MDTIWPPSYGQARFAAEAGGSSGMKIKYFGSVFLDQIMRYNTWLEKHFFSFSLKESSNTLTHKDYTANCSSSKLIVSKRSFSRNFFHHQTSPVKLVYFFSYSVFSAGFAWGIMAATLPEISFNWALTLSNTGSIWVLLFK